MNQKELDAIKERCDKATPGPWKVVSGKSFGVQSENKNIASCFRRENEEFIAHARQDVPTLLAEVERLQQAQRWMPVTERLPERPPDSCYGITARSWYLVALKSGCVMSARFDFDEFLGRTGWQETGTAITHWMPLPQPPKEG